MEQHEHAVVIFFPFVADLGICFSQTRASHNKHDCFGRERPTFADETISTGSYFFQKNSSVNKSVVLNFEIFQGLFGHFYKLTGFSRHFMCIIQI